MNHSLDSLTRREVETKPVLRMPAWLVPILILGSFALLFLALFRDRLLPAPEVRTAVVLATTVEGGESPAAASSSSMLFQASGWIEPDPLPVKATALIDGVVDSVSILEGQEVKKGDLLATLIDDDAKLSLSAAEQNHRMLVSSRAAHLASIEAMKKKLQGSSTRIVAARTTEDEAADRLARVKDLKGAVSASDVVAARLRLEREESMHLSAQSEGSEIEAELERLNLETRAKDDGIAAAAVAVDQARLALERTRILSPIDGRVLRLAAAPGQKKMLLMDDPDSSTIAILYNPEKLQVRVDVPLADAAGLSVGQPAKIRCSLLPDKVFEGEVTRVTGEADLQRNTLQAKVRIQDPVAQLRPEMLCRVEFLGATRSAGPVPGSLATWIPREALADGSVWICDPESRRVARRPVQASPEIRDGMIRITQGIRPGEQVVLSPQGLREGQRANPKQQLP